MFAPEKMSYKSSKNLIERKRIVWQPDNEQLKRARGRARPVKIKEIKDSSGKSDWVVDQTDVLKSVTLKGDAEKDFEVGDVVAIDYIRPPPVRLT